MIEEKMEKDGKRTPGICSLIQESVFLLMCKENYPTE
jgi:hypothetical protein